MAAVSKRPRREAQERKRSQPPPVAGSSSRSNMTMEAQEITDSLQRTKQMMRHELERVSHVTSAMQDDAQLLEQTRDHH
eukprot:scaffold129117_cov63-Attheya_sp.AAC.1